MASALIVLAEGFEEIEALATADVLRRGGVKAALASLGNELETVGAHGIKVCADVTLESVKDELFDAIVLPGGGLGTENLKSSHLLFDILRHHKEEDRLLCAICAAPTVLVEAGVLDPDQQITCYPTCVMELDRKAVAVPAIADGNVITAQGPGSSLLFGLVILKHLTTEALAHKVARAMVTDCLG